MARYTGPKLRISRRLSTNIFENEKGRKALERRPFPPGQHGRTRRRNAGSEYLAQLQEKQKAKFIYGVLERQFRRTYEEANRLQGPTGENLLRLLEQRLDNVVYRMGFASTRAEARQLVSHKGVLVNGKPVNVPSYQCSAGDTVEIREKSKAQVRIQSALQISAQVGRPDWVEVDEKKLSGLLKSVPERNEILPDINENLVVELYSK